MWSRVMCRGGRASPLAPSDSQGAGGLGIKQRGTKRSRGFILMPYKGRSHGVSPAALGEARTIHLVGKGHINGAVPPQTPPAPPLSCLRLPQAEELKK